MPLALLDLDGTLADYDGAIADRMFGDRHLQALGLEKARHLISAEPGFFLNLKPLPDGFMIVEVLRELGFSFHVATKGPRTKPLAWTEKLMWCDKHLPGIPVTITSDKSLIRGDVLVDDWPPYVEAWLRSNPNGKAIMPFRSYNDAWVDDALRHDVFGEGRLFQYGINYLTYERLFSNFAKDLE